MSFLKIRRKKNSLNVYQRDSLKRILMNEFLFCFSASGGGGSMLVPPVVQSGTGDRPVGDTGARAQQTSGPAAAATLWPLAPAQSNQVPNQQSQGIPPLAATPAPAHNQGTPLIL